MQWIDGSEIEIKQYTGVTLCEKLALEMWDVEIDEWSNWADFIQVAYFIIAFDTELTMEGIFAFLENSLGHYAPQIIGAFRAIGDHHDADILEEICVLCPPDTMRDEFLQNAHQEYAITHFDADHELNAEIVEKLTRSSEKLYLYTDLDMWALLFRFVDEKIAAL